MLNPCPPSVKSSPSPTEDQRSAAPAGAVELDKTESGVGTAEALTLRCIELLQQGDVENFNKIRPKGALDLSGVDLRGKGLTGVNFDDVILTRANLERACLTNAKMRRVNAEQASFNDA